ncbi:MAG TPA: right-handed parallel beta-helix repeat-containing protein, partial [Halobacteriales archaeon]|nr:right-handed parallel beta-helix repeat-containing protein [Halobacteriales archaeon]
PQRSTRIVGNEVYGNDGAEAPALSDPYPILGVGILLWGGSENVVENNRVRAHSRFGVVVQHNVVEPSNNVVRENEVGESGVADLALGTPAGDGNRFSTNEFSTSLPTDIETGASEGSTEVTEAFEEIERTVDAGEFPAGDWRNQPTPDEQPTMPDPEATPRPADKTTSWEAPVGQTDGFRLG